MNLYYYFGISLWQNGSELVMTSQEEECFRGKFSEPGEAVDSIMHWGKVKFGEE